MAYTIQRYVHVMGLLFTRNAQWGRGWTRRLAAMAVCLPVFVFVQAANLLGLLLDEVLFPGYRKQDVRAPVFIVGIPRSGTTRLHHVLAEDDAQFTTCSTWELLLAPSIVQRRLFAWIARVDRRVGGGGHRIGRWIEWRMSTRMDRVHAISLRSPEEDYLFLLPLLACFILILPFPASEDVWRLARFDEAVDERERRWIMTYYKRCLQRHLYARGRGRRLLSKNASFCPALRSLRETFPDCRLICCVRDPAATVPSQLSAIEGGARWFGTSVSSEPFRSKMVDALQYYYEHLCACLSEWQPASWVCVSLPELTSHLDKTVGRVYTHFGLGMRPAMRAFLSNEARRARHFESRHRYDPASFGLSVEELNRRMGHCYRQLSRLAGGRDDDGGDRYCAGEKREKTV